MEVIHRNIDFPIWGVISEAGADSNVYRGQWWRVLKIYKSMNPDVLLRYHQIQEYFAQRWNQIIDTPSWKLNVGVLSLWDVYCDEEYWYYTTPYHVEGSRLTIWWTIARTHDAVVDALWVDKGGTNGLMDYNSFVTLRQGKTQHLIITDLWWKIHRFVECNDSVLQG